MKQIFSSQEKPKIPEVSIAAPTNFIYSEGVEMFFQHPPLIKMSLSHKTYKIVALMVFFASVCIPALAQGHTRTEDQQLARLKVIDAALASAEVEFFEHPPAPEVHSSSDGNTFGLTEAQSRENVPDINIKKHLFKVDAELFSFRYKEPGVMKDAGTMRGFYGHYAYRPSPGELLYTKITNLYKIEGRYSVGEVDYKAVSHAELKNIDDWSAELRGIFGKEYVDGPFTTIIYSGAGYRYLNDNNSGRLSTVGDTSYYGYQRESNYYYLPVGLEFSNQINNRWSVAILGEYDWLAYGLQISHLSDGNQFLSTRNDDAENKQDHGYGLRASLRLIRESGIVDLVFEPFIRYWDIEDSEIVSIFVDGATSNALEPENNTIETGLKIGFQF